MVSVNGVAPVDEGQSLTISLSATDLDAGDTLTFSQSGLPAFCQPLVDNGDRTGSINCAPLFADSGSYPFTVTVTDNGAPNLSDSEASTLVVTNLTRTPELNAVGAQNVDEGGSLTIGLLATDADAGDVLTFAVNDLPTFCSLTDCSGPNGAINGAPGHSDSGPHPWNQRRYGDRTAACHHDLEAALPQKIGRCRRKLVGDEHLISVTAQFCGLRRCIAHRRVRTGAASSMKEM